MNILLGNNKQNNNKNISKNNENTKMILKNEKN